MIQPIYILSSLGFLFSIYFLYVRKRQQNNNYKALCDINDIVSCSKVARSRYSNLFILPNAFYGLIFYLAVIVSNYLEMFNFVFYLAIFASLLSIYLIYASLKIKVLCPVCMAIYIINFLLLLFSYLFIY